MLYQKKRYRLWVNFSLVMRFASVRLLLAMVTHLDLEFLNKCLDIIFNEKLDEEIYTKQLIIFEVKEISTKPVVKTSLICLSNHLDSGTSNLTKPSFLWFWMMEMDHCKYWSMGNLKALLWSPCWWRSIQPVDPSENIYLIKNKSNRSSIDSI